MPDTAALSKEFDTPDEAAVAGFQWVLDNSMEWKTKEFAFFVIKKVNAEHKVKYHHTTPQSDGSTHGVKLPAPTGLIPPHAFCHTHPSSLSDAGFSRDDVEEFRRLNSEPYYKIGFYLMDPNRQLHRVTSEADFGDGRLGTPVSWAAGK